MNSRLFKFYNYIIAGYAHIKVQAPFENWVKPKILIFFLLSLDGILCKRKETSGKECIFLVFSLDCLSVIWSDPNCMDRLLVSSFFCSGVYSPDYDNCSNAQYVNKQLRRLGKCDFGSGRDLNH